MIVKIKNDEESWSYFECYIIHSKYQTIGKTNGRGDCVVLLERKDAPMEMSVKVLNLVTVRGHLRVLTDRVCYVTNDQGKTIDRI